MNELKLKTLCHFILARGVLYQQFLQRLNPKYQEVENPNQILWIREKTKFITYLAGHLTDLYSDNKPTKIQTDQKIQVSWSDTPDLLDLDAAEIADIEHPSPK